MLASQYRHIGLSVKTHIGATLVVSMICHFSYSVLHAENWEGMAAWEMNSHNIVFGCLEVDHFKKASIFT